MTTTPPQLLIHTPDTLIAALLGAMFEQAGARSVFCERNESVESAARRIKPQLILADVAATQRVAGAPMDVSSLSLDKVALELRATLVLFGTEEDCAVLRSAGHECFALPAQREALRKKVSNLLREQTERR